MQFFTIVVLAFLAVAAAFMPAGNMARYCNSTFFRDESSLLLTYQIILLNNFLISTRYYRRMIRSDLEMKSTGKVKFFDVQKGFGFITPTAGGEDVFVHQTAIHSRGFRSLAEGEDVEYEMVEDDKRGKKCAANVTGPGGDYVQGAPRNDDRNF